jgi:transglutaminase-like putative cysteine protease
VRLRIEHTTVFSYDEPVSECYTEVRLKPREGQGQRCLSFSLSCDPTAPVHAYADRYGNEVLHFDLLSPHDRLVVTARSEVETEIGHPGREVELSLLDRFDFLVETDYAPFGAEVRALAGTCVVPGDAAATASRVLWAVRKRLRYETGSTDVTTSAEEALRQGKGVCQDFAHLMLACCRVLSVPARYVSGYIHAPGSRSEAASHAWVDVFAERQGWISLDPTHDSTAGARHVRVAVGRDYADVPPTRGVWKGNAQETLEVTVRIDAV